jgi:hypothetical protein
VAPREPGRLERFEASSAGRALLSVLLVALVAGIVVVNLPDSKLRDTASEVTEPMINVLGLNQNWNVFAPEPRKQSIGLEARVTFVDGGHASWRPYEGGDLVASYRDYRWGKYMENVRQDQNRGLWPGLAAWVARRAAQDKDRKVARVVLVRRWRDVLPPGAKRNEGPPRLYVFYRWRPGRA